MKGQYTGFWIRFIAYSIDSFIILILAKILFYFLMYTPATLFQILVWYFISMLFFDVIYEIFLTSFLGGTFGKILMKCKVIDVQGNNLSLLRSTGRYFSKFISTIIFGIGFLMIGWDTNKQGIHDKIAKTHVIYNTKSRTKNWIKIGVMIIVIILILDYVLFLATMFVAGISFGIEATTYKSPSNNALIEFTKLCESKPTFLRDFCYASFPRIKEPFVSMNTSIRLELCSKVKSSDMHTECVIQLARFNKNKAICTDARSNWYQRYCSKSYDLSESFLHFLGLDMSAEKSFSGNLSVGKVITVLESNDNCDGSNSSQFYQEDTICFTFLNLSGFEKDSNNLDYYDLTLNIWDKDKNLIRSDKHILDGGIHVFLENDVLKSEVITSKLMDMTPSQYLYEFIWVDKISNKGIIINQSVIIRNGTRERLRANDIILGRYSRGFCIPEPSNIFTPDESLCFMPVNATGFEKNDKKLNKVRMDITTRDNDGRIYSTLSLPFDELSGYTDLKNNLMNNKFVSLVWNKKVYGNYTLDITLVDEISNKYMTISKNIQLVNNTNKQLQVGGVIVGSNSYYNSCDIKKLGYVFFIYESICLQPINVTGFERGPDGLNWFDMDLRVLDQDGNVVEYSTELFGQDGHVLLDNGELNDQWVYTSLVNYEFGTYTYEVRVYDVISGKEAILKAPFVVRNY